MLYACAQAGCQACVEQLFRQHARLVHWIIRRACCGDLLYGELLHSEGQISLWQAILHYDAARGLAFSTTRHRLRPTNAAPSPTCCALAAPATPTANLKNAYNPHTAKQLP